MLLCFYLVRLFALRSWGPYRVSFCQGLVTETYREHGGRLLRQRHDLRAIVGREGLDLDLLGTGTLRKAAPIGALDDIASNFPEVAALRDALPVLEQHQR
jgi:hypothetical protein